MTLINFPLMLVPFAVYNFFILTGELNHFEDVILRFDVLSGASFTLSMGELLIIISLLLLYTEVLKATRAASWGLIDRLLSTLILVAYLAEFLLVPRAGTATFFILMVVTLVDVAAGYSLSIRHASRNLTIEH